MFPLGRGCRRDRREDGFDDRFRLGFGQVLFGCDLFGDLIGCGHDGFLVKDGKTLSGDRYVVMRRCPHTGAPAGVSTASAG